VLGATDAAKDSYLGFKREAGAPPIIDIQVLIRVFGEVPLPDFSFVVNYSLNGGSWDGR